MENLNKKIFTMSVVSTALSVVCIILMIVFTIHINNLEVRIMSLEKNGGSSLSDVIDNTLPGDLVEDEKTIDDVISRTDEAIKEIRSSNKYMIMQMSNADDTDALITNTKGEGMYQDASGNVLVYLKNGNSVYYEENIYYGSDVPVIDQLRSAIVNSKSVGARVLQTQDLDTDGVEEYCFDIYGWDNIEKSMASLGEEYAHDVAMSIKQGLQEYGQYSAEQLEHINMRYSVAFKDGKIAGMGCFYFIGEGATGAWKNCTQEWAIGAIVDVYDWEIPESFYNFDWSTIQTADATELAKMCTDALDNVQTMLNKFDEDNGYTDVSDAANSNDTDSSDK